MEGRKARSNLLDDNPNQRKISRGLVRHVLTKNTNDRIALGKVTRQLDKERIAKRTERTGLSATEAETFTSEV